MSAAAAADRGRRRVPAEAASPGASGARLGRGAGRPPSRRTPPTGSSPARVAIEYNHLFRLYTGEGELQGQHAGRVLHAAAGRHALAAVGDWVAILPAAQERTATIEAILPRRTHFSRKAAGELTEQQVVAANIDVVFLVMGLDRDYNPRRLERYLLLARESGATPHVLLSKADLADDVAAPLAEIGALAPGVALDAVSVRDGRGLAARAPRPSAPARPARCWAVPGPASPP